MLYDYLRLGSQMKAGADLGITGIRNGIEADRAPVYQKRGNS